MFALVLSTALASHAALAQTRSTVRVETITGQTWEGEVVSDTPKELVLRGSGGQFPIPHAAIKSITKLEDRGARTAAKPIGQAIKTKVNLLRLHGSNVIGSQLAPDLVSAFGKQKKYTTSHEEPGTSPNERLIVLNAPESTESLRAEIFAHGSATAFLDMIGGTTDIGMSSRQPTPGELEALRGSVIGDVTQGASENIIGLDGIAFIVNPNNPIKSLSFEQLHDLLTGAKKNWSMVGGPNMPVTIYSPDLKSGTYELLKQKLMAPDGRLAPGAKLFESNEDLADAIASDASALGITSIAFVRNAKPLPIDGGCGIPPVEPDAFVVKTEEYPLSRRLYFYTGGQRSELTDQFIAFATAASASPIVETAGFVGLEPTLSTQAFSEARLSRLATGLTMTPGGRDMRPERDLELQTLKDARRLSITFRFAVGQTSVDSRSAMEFDRLARWSQSAGAGRQIILVGFSSTDGDYAGNVSLSRRRAAEIEAGVKRLGVANTKSIGVGPIDQVVCEADAASANLNRRVEVWVK
jgi:phosphate transport system substrate-binding protein